MSKPPNVKRPYPTDPWQAHEGLCNARKTNGTGLCRHECGWGTDHPGIGCCKMHGGCTPSGQIAAARVRQARELAALLATHKPALADSDPYAGLLEVVQSTWAARRTFEQLVGELLDRGQITDDGEASPDALEQLLAPDHTGDLRIHPYVRELREWTTEHARACKLAIDAGIAERQIQLAEDQADLLATVLRGVLVELGVWDQPGTPDVVKRHLRALPTGNAA